MPYRQERAYHASFRIFQIVLDALSELSLLSVLAMALFRDLISSVAQAEGLSEMTVAGIGQYLRDAGFISKHGRGRAAAQMTSLDAANLLIGVNASDLAKNAVSTVSSYGDLQIARPEKNNINHWAISRIFEKGANLQESISILVDAFIPREDGTTAFSRDAGIDQYTIEIGFGRPAPSAFINLAQIGPPSPTNPFKWLQYSQIEAFGHYWDKAHLWSSTAGRRDLTIVDGHTLSAIGKVLAK